MILSKSSKKSLLSGSGSFSLLLQTSINLYTSLLINNIYNPNINQKSVFYYYLNICECISNFIFLKLYRNLINKIKKQYYVMY